MHQLIVPVSDRDHAAGPAHAPIVLVEYGDYECPYCGLAEPVVKTLQRHYQDRLRFVFRNFPLTDLHEHALRAAETAEWAATQGMFWPIHDDLLNHQRALRSSDLLALVAGRGLDPSALERAWRERAMIPRIEHDVSGGSASGVHGTPTFFVNGVRHDGASTVDDLARTIEARLERVIQIA